MCTIDERLAEDVSNRATHNLAAQATPSCILWTDVVGQC